jgi:hypothetical protein
LGSIKLEQIRPEGIRKEGLKIFGAGKEHTAKKKE